MLCPKYAIHQMIISKSLDITYRIKHAILQDVVI